jgi:hypothetical protein
MRVDNTTGKGTSGMERARAYVMVTINSRMGAGDLQPGCSADRLLTGLGRLQINP